MTKSKSKPGSTNVKVRSGVKAGLAKTARKITFQKSLPIVKDETDAGELL